MIVRHRCTHPWSHQLGIWLGLGLWVLVGACWGVPKLVFWFTASGAWTFLSIPLALLTGTMILAQVFAWRCRVRYAPHRASNPAHDPLVALVWATKEDTV